MRRTGACFPTLTLLAALVACHHLPPDLDEAEQRASRVQLGAQPEAEARAREEAGDLTGAVDVRRALARSRPRDAAALRELARSELLAGLTRRAGLDFEDAVYRAADRAAAEEDAARLYRAAALPRPAIRWIRLALAYPGPRRPARLVLLAELGLAAGDPDAGTVIQSVAGSGDPEALDQAVVALLAAGQGARALALAPAGSRAHARAALAAGDATSAISQLRPLAEAGDPAAAALLAEARGARGELAAAQAGLELAAAAARPGSDPARLLLARLRPARAAQLLAPLLAEGGEAGARAALVLAQAASDPVRARRLLAHAASDPFGYQAGAEARGRLAATGR